MSRTTIRKIPGLLLGGAFLAAACASQTAAQQSSEPVATYLDRLPQDEVIYFVMPDRFENGDPSNDRGGIEGTRLEHGFDPTDNGFYHGGDLKGLTDRLDYIHGLGATAIWLTPIFENKAVQGPPGQESAAYHGYWITDFLNVDPHLGTREDFAAFVEAAHVRDMKVYMDIITNHSADVIQYRECSATPAPGDEVGEEGCVYRSKGAYPWTTDGGPDGPAINESFLGSDPDAHTVENFEKLTNPDWAYHPFVPDAEKDIKNPAWLNDPIYYHNRGNSAFEGESSRFGDFAGLDDLMTEDPRVVEGFIDIYKQWITDFRVDGFRIDTAKHVNPEFWQAFVPAMEDHAASLGIDNFHIFGEVYEFDAGRLSAYTTRDRLTSVLDFAFQGVIRDVVVNGAPARRLEELFEVDHSYADGLATAAILPTFLGNHDMGRFAGFLREADPDMSDDEMLARLKLAHAMLIFSRGVPTIYYGDEQGFVSDGGDRGARENMFESQVPDYNDNVLVGTRFSTADNNFYPLHPLYRAIADMAEIRSGHAALRRGEQVIRHSDKEGGVFVMSRFSEDRSREYLIAFNADEEARRLAVSVDGAAQDWSALHGQCAVSASAPGSYMILLAPLDFLICYSDLKEPAGG